MFVLFEYVHFETLLFAAVVHGFHYTPKFSKRCELFSICCERLSNISGSYLILKARNWA